MAWNIFTNRAPFFHQLKVDMHAHLIPGLDDGVKNIQESLSCLHHLSLLGYQKIITTPHIMGDYYPNSKEVIQASFLEVKEKLQQTNINVDLSVAAEYFLDDFFLDLLNGNDPLLTLHQDLLLVELSTFIKSEHVLDTIFRIQAKGYRPVLAHPERYLYYAKEFEFLRKLKQVGCFFQINILSLFGHYGQEVKKFGHAILKEGLVDYLGTDVHHLDHTKKLVKVWNKRLPKYARPDQIRNAHLLLG